jgi:CrcB protein
VKIYLLVMAGGALGSAARFWLSTAVADKIGESFPLGTLVVNVTGSFIIGVVYGVTGPNSPLLVAPEWRIFLMMGVLGGFTTFSSFSLNTLTLLQNGQWFLAGLNAVLSVFLCLVGAWFGYVLANLWISKL